MFNVILAQLLQERGVVSAPEDVLRMSPTDARKMPDVLVDYSGLRIAIEGEVDDQQNYGPRALESAKRRVEQGIAHIGIAVIYPSKLRESEFIDLKSDLSKCELRIAVFSEAGKTDFRQGDVDDLGEVLRRAFGELVKEDVVAKAVDELEKGISIFTNAVIRDRGTIGRLAEVLGIQELPKRDATPESED